MAILGLRSLFWNCCASVGGSSLCCTGADDTTVQAGRQGGLQPPIFLSGSADITKDRKRKKKRKTHTLPVSPDDNITIVESTRDTSKATQFSGLGRFQSGVALELQDQLVSRDSPEESSQRKKTENHPEAPSVVLMNERAQRHSSFEKKNLQLEVEKRSMSVAQEGFHESRTSTPQTPQIVRRGTIASINGSLPSRRSSRLPPKRWPKDTLSVKPSKPSNPTSPLLSGSDGFSPAPTLESHSTPDRVSPGFTEQSSLLKQNPAVRSVHEDGASELSTTFGKESDVSEKKSLAPVFSPITLPEPWQETTSQAIPLYYKWDSEAKQCLASNLRKILEYFRKHTSFSGTADCDTIGLPICVETPELGVQKRYGDMLINYQTAEWYVRLKDSSEPSGNFKSAFPLQRTVAEAVTMPNLSNSLDITVNGTEQCRLAFQEPHAALNCRGFLFVLRLLRNKELTELDTQEKNLLLPTSDAVPFGAADSKANTGPEATLVALPGLSTSLHPARLFMGPVGSSEAEAEREKNRREEAKARIYKQTPFSMLVKATVPRQKSGVPSGQTLEISA